MLREEGYDHSAIEGRAVQEYLKGVVSDVTIPGSNDEVIQQERHAELMQLAEIGAVAERSVKRLRRLCGDPVNSQELTNSEMLVDTGTFEKCGRDAEMLFSDVRRARVMMEVVELKLRHHLRIKHAHTSAQVAGKKITHTFLRDRVVTQKWSEKEVVKAGCAVKKGYATQIDRRARESWNDEERKWIVAMNRFTVKLDDEDGRMGPIQTNERRVKEVEAELVQAREELRGMKEAKEAAEKELRRATQSFKDKQKEAERRSTRAPMGGKQCYNCHGYGHIARLCTAPVSKFESGNEHNANAEVRDRDSPSHRTECRAEAEEEEDLDPEHNHSSREHSEEESRKQEEGKEESDKEPIMHELMGVKVRERTGTEQYLKEITRRYKELLAEVSESHVGSMNAAVDLWENPPHNWPRASERVRRWIREGYKIPLKSNPKPTKKVITYTQANEEAREAMERIVIKDYKAGAVQLTARKGSRKPFLVSPTSVIEKKEKGKWRLIQDSTAGGLNEHIKDQPFTSLTWESVAKHLFRGAWLTVVDLKAGFSQLRFHKDSRKYTGFQMDFKTMEAGVLNIAGKRYLTCEVMNFGVKSSPYAFNEVMKEVLRIPRDVYDVVVLIYVDDMMIISRTEDEALDNTQTILYILAMHGVWANLAKSSLAPERVKDYLGFIVDATRMVIRAPEGKIEKFERRAREIIKAAAHGKKVKVNEVEKCAGLLQCMALAIAPARRMARAMYTWIAQTKRGNSNGGRVTEEVVQDLKWSVHNLREWNGVIPLDKRDPTVVWGSDAAGREELGWGGYMYDAKESSPEVHLAAGFWKEGQTEREHINELELRGALRCMKAMTHIVGRKQEVQVWLLQLDNTTAVAYVNRGGGESARLTEVAREIHAIALTHGAIVRAEHVPGIEHVVADKLSRREEKGDWKLNEGVFEEYILGHPSWEVDSEWVDGMASSLNRQSALSRFVSKYNDVGAWQTDFFSLDLRETRVYVNPPWRLAEETLDYIDSFRGAEAIVVLPDVAAPYQATLERMSVGEKVRLSREKNLFSPRGSGRRAKAPPFETAVWKVRGSGRSARPNKQAATPVTWRQFTEGDVGC